MSNLPEITDPKYIFQVYFDSRDGKYGELAKEEAIKAMDVLTPLIEQQYERFRHHVEDAARRMDEVDAEAIKALRQKVDDIDCKVSDLEKEKEGHLKSIGEFYKKDQ